MLIFVLLFQFPTTDIVQFKAVVTPCLGTCAPAVCKTENPDGTVFTLNSYGRRRRRSIESNKFRAPKERKANKPVDESGEEEVVVVQSIKITDNFAFDKESESLLENKELKQVEYDLEKIGLKGAKSVKKPSTLLSCLSSTTITLLVLACGLIQIGFIAFWIYFKQALKSTKQKQWWKQQTLFDNQIDSVRYSNTQYNPSPSSFYNSSRPTPSSSMRNQKI